MIPKHQGAFFEVLEKIALDPKNESNIQTHKTVNTSRQDGMHGHSQLDFESLKKIALDPENESNIQTHKIAHIPRQDDIHKYFTGISRKTSESQSKVEAIFDRFDSRIDKLYDIDEDGDNRIILAGILLLQDILHQDVPFSSEGAKSALNHLVKDFQKDIIHVDQMFNDESGYQKPLLKKLKSYVAERYKDMPDSNDLETLSLVAKFNKIDPSIVTDGLAFTESKKHQRGYKKFGWKRIRQVESFNRWTKSSDFQQIMVVYGILRSYKIDCNYTIPVPKRDGYLWLNV